MKILVWNECYLAGGADWSLIDLITAWRRERADEFVVYVNETHEGLPLLQAKLNGLAEVRTYVSPLERVNGWVGPNASRPLRLAAWGLACFVSLLNYGARIPWLGHDVLISNNGGFPGGISNYLAGVAAHWIGVPVRLMIVRNYPTGDASTSAVLRWARRLSYRRYLGVVAVSHSLRESLLRHVGFTPDFVQVIHNGVALENKTGNSAARSPDHPLTAGIIGTLEPRKGHSVLFRAWAKVLSKHPQAKLLVVGSSKSGDGEGLRSLADQLQISHSIVWQDFTNAIGEVYDRLDVAVVPSQAMESFGRVVAEAMAFGKPVIASRIGGMPELIEEGVDGWLFAPQDVDALALHLDRVFSATAGERSVWGASGRAKFAEKFTSKRMADDYRRLVAKLSSPTALGVSSLRKAAR